LRFTVSILIFLAIDWFICLQDARGQEKSQAEQGSFHFSVFDSMAWLTARNKIAITKNGYFIY
jgi:hypothetical protein